MKKFIILCLFLITINSCSLASLDGYNCDLEETDDLQDFKDMTENFILNNQFEDLIKIYNICIQKYPEKDFLYNNRANAYKKLKKFDKALIDYDKALELYPNYIAALNGKLSLLILQLKLDDALILSEKIIKLNPNSANVYYNRGLIFELKQDFNNAIKNYNLAIQHNPEQFPIAYYNRGSIYLNKGDYHKAIKDYKECLFYINNASKNNIDISSISKGDIYYNLGLSFLKINDLNSALVNFKNSLKFYELENNKKNLESVKDYIEKLQFQE